MTNVETFSVKAEDVEIFNKFKKMAGGSNSSRVMDAIKFYYAHKKNQNSDKITSFVDNLVKTPDLFDDKDDWEKYMENIKTLEEYKRVDNQLNLIVRIFNKKHKELSKGI